MSQLEARMSGNAQAFDVLTEWLHEIRNSIDHHTTSVSQHFENTNQSIQARLDHANRVFSELNRELGQMQEIGRQIQKFQDILQSPKLRGNVGEQILHDLLAQILPKGHYSIQHRFRNGTAVDAVIQTDRGIIPIDSKFPISSFRRYQNAEDAAQRQKYSSDFASDVKKHISDVNKKYILPEEGTTDFALIYIPSEIIYYEILQLSDHIATFANEKNILLVSPNNFYYFLKIIMVAFEGKRIEAAGKKILNMFSALRQDSQRLNEQLRILNGHFNNARGALDRVNLETQQLYNRIETSRYLGINEDEDGNMQNLID